MKHVFTLFLFLFLNSLLAQQQEYEVFNTTINSKYAELGVTYFDNNTILFASSKKNKNDINFKKNRRKQNRQMYLEIYQSKITKNGDLIIVNEFNNDIKNMFFESDVSFSPDYKTVYFTWNNFYSTTSKKDSTKWKTLHIVKATIDNNFNVSNITTLPFSSKEYSVRSPHVSASGKQLFFISNMPNGYGNFDIYVVDINKNGTYSEPENLGANVNTRMNESFPYVTHDNTLYFSSYGHKGKGSLDIFKSEFKNGSYQKIENLPSPINSKYDDFAFVMNSSKSGFFTSNREQGKGDVDIYAFKPKEKIAPCTKDITGIIVNKETKKSIENAIISLYYNTILQETKIISKDFKYSFKLKCSENYKIVAKKENYIPSEIEILVDESYDNEIDRTIELIPTKCVQLITGSVLQHKTSIALANYKVSLFKNDVQIKTVQVTNEPKFKFDLECEATYKIVAEKEGYIANEIEFKTNKVNATEIAKTIVLTPVKCVQLVTGIVQNSETNITLENYKVSLFNNGAQIKTVQVNNGLNFKFDLECEESYKIVAEKEGYIANEIEFKINKVTATEIAKTIVLTPIKCVQFITGTVQNSETNIALENYKVSLFNNGIQIKTVQVTNKLKFNFDLECDESYKITTKKEGYLENEIEFKTNKVTATEIAKTIVLTPIKCVQFITGAVQNSKSNVSLENYKVSLFKNGVQIKIVQVSNGLHFKFDLKCEETYKIVVEKEGYITNEIEFKTNKVTATEIAKTIVLTPIKCVQLITGTVQNSKSNIALENYKVSLFNNGNHIKTLQVTNGVKFNFDLKCEESYKIVAKKEGYLENEIEFKTNKVTATEITRTIELIPAKCVQLFTGTILDENTSSPLSNAIVKIYKNNDLIGGVNIDNKASFSYEMDCNTQYRVVASLKNYQDDIIVIKTSNKLDEKLTKTLFLKPVEEFITVREQKMIKTNSIDFDLDKYEITLDAAIELEKVITLLNRYPSIKVEVKSHTDSRAPDNYNLSLSIKRAKATIDYIISNGIDTNRVSGNGYGETQLLNKCSNGVKCTQAEHEINRRTEFIIIEE